MIRDFCFNYFKVLDPIFEDFDFFLIYKYGKKNKNKPCSKICYKFRFLSKYNA